MESQQSSKRPKGFGSGVLAGLSGYAVMVGLFAIWAWRVYGESWTGAVLLFGGLMVLLWVPAILVAGAISRRRGFRSALWFIWAAVFVSYLAWGGCLGVLGSTF